MYFPEDYRPLLGQHETEKAIKDAKDTFERSLSGALRLSRVTSPLFVPSGSGINDDLNGVENPVRFAVKKGEWSDSRIKSASLEYVRGAAGIRHKVTADDFSADRVFGTPSEDQSMIIWSLVDRLFPDPMPWKDD